MPVLEVLHTVHSSLPQFGAVSLYHCWYMGHCECNLKNSHPFVLILCFRYFGVVERRDSGRQTENQKILRLSVMGVNSVSSAASRDKGKSFLNSLALSVLAGYGYCCTPVMAHLFACYEIMGNFP